MRKRIVITGVILLCIAAIIFLIPVPIHLGLTLYDLNEHCNRDDGGYVNYQDAPSCIETQQRVNVMYAVGLVGLIVVIVGTVVPSKMRK